VSDVNGARIATGIYLYASGNNNLELTNIELVGAGNLYAHGLHLSHANYNHFFATAINDIQGHLTYGIFFSEAENNTCDSTRIKNITSDGPDAFGINMDSSQYNTFTETDIMAVSSGENVAYGICFAYAHNNIVTRARIVSTEQARIDCAVYLWDSRKNTINESDIRNNGHGFRLNQSDNNIIERNMIVNNTALAISGLSLSTGSDNNEIHENCFYYNGYEFRQASDDGSQNNLDRNYWEPPPGPLGDPYRIFGDAMNRDRDPLAFCPLCAVEAPALTPTGLIALVSLLSAIAAVTIVRKRR
jgi:parallel beta-helix repeat protein